jgi:hypothetical protein
VIHDEIAALDGLLASHAGALGGDAEGYRNHAYRVANLCAALAPGPAVELEKIGVVAALHDIGIWTDRDWADVSRGGRRAWAAGGAARRAPCALAERGLPPAAAGARARPAAQPSAEPAADAAVVTGRRIP